MSVSQSLASLTAREMLLAASCSLPEEERAPPRHIIMEHNRKNLRMQRIQLMVWLHKLLLYTTV